MVSSDRLRVIPDDCIVTTYEMVKSTAYNNSLKRIRFRYLVIDEGHKIKNEKTDLALAVRGINSQNRLLLTGTPLQNNLHELWALLNFLLPDVFSDSQAFDPDVLGGSGSDAFIHQLHAVLRP
jgi:SWI/SNF-related matrix-associated actin-dependent regulator of chromatin subfamily A member 5